MDDLLNQLTERFSATPASGTSVMLLAVALVPMLAAASVWVWRPPDRATQGAIVLAATWNAVGLLALNSFAVRLGWWQFEDAGPSIGEVPVVPWIGWIVLWGVLAPLSPWRPAATVCALAIVDLIYMPAMDNVLDLGSTWLVGELAGLVLIAWPGLLLARWSVDRSHLAHRVRLQVIMFSVVLFWAIPMLAASGAGRLLHLDVPTWAFGGVLFGVGGASLPAVTAVYDFYLNAGSPWPSDSTARPVRSGPYRYVRSPMQASATLLLITMAFLYGEPAIAVAVGIAILYNRLFCQLEADDLERRFGPAWADLGLAQRRWLPSWRPHRGGETATVWVNFDCDVCAPIAGFLERRPTQGLVIRDAAEHGKMLYRLRYERADGAQFDGVSGVGACLEHIHLGWAMIGWTLRLPVVWRFWQLIGDAVGFGPRRVSPLIPTFPRPAANEPLTCTMVEDLRSHHERNP